MTDESFNEKLVGEMFIAYVSNNRVAPSQIADVVRAISNAMSKDNNEELLKGIIVALRLGVLHGSAS